jgi:hypothetical protein
VISAASNDLFLAISREARRGVQEDGGGTRHRRQGAGGTAGLRRHEASLLRLGGGVQTTITPHAAAIMGDIPN